MALVNFNFYSVQTEMNSSLQIILPEQAKAPFPLLYLLHDDGGNHTTLTRQMALERLAEEAGVAIVLPTTLQGCWADMKDGYRFFRLLSEELPEIIRTNFPCIDTDPAHTAVLGMGLGGYGALKFALRYPALFAQAGALDGTLDLAALYRKTEQEAPDTLYRLKNAYGEGASYRPEENDLLTILANDKQPLSAVTLFVSESGEGTGYPAFAEAYGKRAALEQVSLSGSGYDAFAQAVKEMLHRMGSAR